MRDLDAPQKMPTLGPARKPEAKPPAAPAQAPGARSGVLVGPDGKMQTNIPTPRVLPWGIYSWEFWS